MLAEMTCEIWKVNINLILLGSIMMAFMQE